MSQRIGLAVGIIVGLGGVAFAGLVWSFTPVSVAHLEQMSPQQRRAYLQNRETSDVVNYYCGDQPLTPEVVADVEYSLREDHGVGSCGGEDGTLKTVTSAS